MKQRLAHFSLHTQLTLVALVSVLILLSAAGLATLSYLDSTETLRPQEVQIVHLKLIVGLLVAAGIAFAFTLSVLRRLTRPLETIRIGLTRIVENKLDDVPQLNAPNRDTLAVQQSFDLLIAHLRSQDAHRCTAEKTLASRTMTVDRLLEFSQTIQGAGKMDQVYDGLAHFLRTELNLAGLAILSHEPESMPSTTIRARWPDDVFKAECSPADMEPALCPCLRQNLPRCFRAEGSPVRCSIDASLQLDKSHPAYCIPFNIGGKTNVLVHMLLPANEVWTDERKQLAHTYVNTAHSTLMSLHLLAEAEKQSMTDGLTGLYNRRSMESLMQREVALTERHGHALTVVMIDMDKFKTINDDYGHAAGDHMLKTFADCVRITLRKTDLAFRYGGDEFVIALPQTPILQAQAVVQKLRQAFASVDFSSAIARLDHQPTLSIGVAERSKAQNILTLPNLLAAADQALYDAKAANRDCIKLYQAPQAA